MVHATLTFYCARTPDRLLLDRRLSVLGGSGWARTNDPRLIKTVL